MKSAGFALALALVVGLTGFSVWARPQSSASVSTPASGPEVIPGATAESMGPVPGDRLQAAAEVLQELPQEVPRAQDSRRRGRNRYPGPIPTPAEWVPPEGPVRIGLQAGHWKANEAPAELSGIRDNGTHWGSKAEWEVNLEIAQQTGALLEELGYEVDILPAVVPPSYRSHLFISIHADGSNDPRASGFRVAQPRQDATGRASGFVKLLQESYGKETELRQLPTVTHRMQSYYAFNFRRYEHALHPMTIGVIIETGFLTNSKDRKVIIDDTERAAKGIVEAVKAFPETPPPKSHLQ